MTAEWVSSQANSVCVWYQEQFEAVDPDTTHQLLGLFEPSHMQNEHYRPVDEAGEPSLSQMTAKAIDILSRNHKGFFLQTESLRIEHAHHATNPFRTLLDTIELSRAVRTSMDKVDLSETLIILTADHSHVFTIGDMLPAEIQFSASQLAIVAAVNRVPSLGSPQMTYLTQR